MRIRPIDWRAAAGLAVLVLLAAITLVLLPPYWRSLEYQRALAAVAARGLDPAVPDSALVAEALREAGRLNLPVRAEQVRIRRARGRAEVSVLYDVPVRVPLYSVDLHFRPRGRAP